jgi:hypothetical protein
LAERQITTLPTADRLVRFAPGTGQRFIVTVDTEEEFDWTQPLDRTSHGLRHVPLLAKFQQFCEGFGVSPVYLVDYPIATCPAAAEAIGDALQSGKAEVGVQLHPWVSPPFDEELNEYNSFAGNLPPALEREKFARLYHAICDNLGATPLAYRAGRYGVGPNTQRILKEFGLPIDTSARSHFDYSATGGANFRDLPLHPWWVDEERQLMELPLTTLFWGPLRKSGRWLYPRLWRAPRLRGALSRLNMLERIPMTPEGTSLKEALRGVDMAVAEQLPVIVLSFHSPSLGVGYTPYVRSEDELDGLYNWWRTVFTALMERKVQPTSLAGIMQSVALA